MSIKERILTAVDTHSQEEAVAIVVELDAMNVNEVLEILVDLKTNKDTTKSFFEFANMLPNKDILIKCVHYKESLEVE